MIKAVWDAILVKAEEKQERMQGKYIIPDTTQERAVSCTIIDVGPGKWNAAGTERIPMSFAPGDKVLIPQIGSFKTEWDGIEYLLISEAAVLALVNNEK